ncbi:helix-turn-helix transcriptional regulator [Streptomyces sp. NBC_01341]|uniref:helix-turn-helix domain-containing protein n=1 Tax=Streptomyces sp. NBC_01341 TaxID=2903831 RepID=UPI002E162E05|nr:helix-turn-helix transcriptional regulator [Streptomyces sp. NBC_01341]
MPHARELDPYTDARAFYGSELRRLREAASMSQGQLGERVFCSGSYIGMFEAAERRPHAFTPDHWTPFVRALGSGSL